MPSSFECVLDIKASLGECPVWSVDEQVLYWVDINAPSLNRFDPPTGNNTAYAMPRSIGSFALRATGGFVVALRDGIWCADAAGKLERKIVEAPYDPAHHRFNDGRADRQGRFWVGSMNEKRDTKTAALYRVDPDLTLHTVLTGLVISNGLAFSPDERTLYHADTPTLTVHAYDYDAGGGSISGKRVFAKFSADTERPDGAAVDGNGCYWIAFYRAGKVAQIAPDGRLIAEYGLPALCPTMCAFGGADLKTLYVTTARQQRSSEELSRLPQSGGVFAMRVDVAGQPEPEFGG